VVNIDPAFTNDWQSSVVGRAVYDPLFRARGDPIQNEPWLAESFDVNEDLTVWTIHLRSGVTFHDGSPVNAEAVKYSFDRLMALQGGYAFLWATLITEDSVQVIDDLTVEFTLTQPFTPFISTLAAIYVVNPTLVMANEVDGDWGSAWLLDHEAGSGPYTISRWEPGTLYELTKVDDYWAGWTHDTSPDIFRFIVYREASSARLALEAGEIDWFPGLLEEDYALLEGNENIEIITRPALTVNWIFMNTTDGPTSDVNVRKALRHAFDYVALNQILFDLGPLNYVMPSSLPGAVEYPDLQKTDLDLARDYLAQSAYPDGGFELDYIYVAGYTPEEDAGLVLLEAASKLNITVNLIPKTWGEMVTLCSDSSTVPDMINMFIGMIYPDPYPYLAASFTTSAPTGYSTCHNYLNQELSDKIEQAATEPDEATRLALYADVQDELYDSAFGIMIGTVNFIEAHNKHWQADTHTALFAYVGWLTDYYFVH
jgi:peptide/nickel transport system substrate-binding protein